MSVNFTRYETAMHDLKIKLAQTIRERDEARARADGLERLVKLYGLLDDGSSIERAEAEGYRRGIEDAAKEMTELKMPTCAKAILALLEQTGDTNSPHLESSAGNSPKR